MRRLLATSILAATFVVAPSAIAQFGTPEPGAASDCVARAGKTASPTTVVLGEAVTIALELALECPEEPAPLDVALVLDRSSSMLGEPIAAAKAASNEIVDLVGFGHTRIAVVSFARNARVDVELSRNATRVRSAIARIEADGTTDISSGLLEAGRALHRSSTNGGAAKAIVLLTDGQDGLGPDAVRYQAAAQRDSGIYLVTIALGLRADAALLREIASSPSDAYEAPDTGDLAQVFARIADRLSTIQARDVVVRDLLPADMVLVPGSVRPVPTATGKELVWRLPSVPAPGIRLEYQVRPVQTGLRPTNTRAEASFVDTAGLAGSVEFPVPAVMVLAERPSPTPRPTASPTGRVPGLTPGVTATGPSPGSTLTAPAPGTSATPGGTRIAVPTVTVRPGGSGTPAPGTGSPGPGATGTGSAHVFAYLPLVGRGLCRWEIRPTDIVLVVDASTTMREPTVGGERKIDAAAGAMRALVGRLSLGQHRVALVSFNATARVLLGLSADGATFDAAIGTIETARGSRIDLGLSLAGAVLASSDRHGNADGIVVLLSDGRPVDATEADVRTAADELNSDGVTVFAVALGANANKPLLQELVQVPSRQFVDAGEGERLDAIYEDIALRLQCR